MILLTDEEFADAQMDYIKKHQEETGETLWFPLLGELRDDCNRKAQLKKVANDLTNILEDPAYYNHRQAKVWEYVEALLKEIK